MKNKHPLYRQSLEFYIAIKALKYYRERTTQKPFSIGWLNKQLTILLDSVILTKKSTLNQILPTNSVYVEIDGDSPITIKHEQLLTYESTYDLIADIRNKIDKPESDITKRFSLVFPNKKDFLDNLEKQVNKYAVKFVDNQLHANNACNYEYQVDMIKAKIIELSTMLNINHLRLHPDDIFSEHKCCTHFVEVMGTLYLSGQIDLHYIDFDIKNGHVISIGVKNPDIINVSRAREYFGLKVKRHAPSLPTNYNYVYENNSLMLKLTDGSLASISLANAPLARYVFETFYELRKNAPLDKKSFSRSEIIKMYKHRHRSVPELDLQDIEPGKLGEVIANCKSVMFKGENKNYKDKIVWQYDRASDGYLFEIK